MDSRHATADQYGVRAITQPLVISRDQHNVSRSNISRAALNVLYKLKDAGYEGYLVGGGVRDLLMGLEPKDFDIATAATPEEIKSLFRSCRLIGRRFRLAHVRFGREIIEVATFRGRGSDADGEDVHVDDAGRILRDNVYGTLEEDAWRRDFSVNGLYYSVEDFSIRDLVGGMQDLRERRVRLLGDPQIRYREDPVRMLRAVRIANKLGFGIESASEAPLSELGHLLQDVPPARLFDEVLKLFMNAQAVENFDELRRYGLLEHLFPALSQALRDAGDRSPEEAFIRQALSNTATRLEENKPVTPAFLFAAFLWPPIKHLAARLRDENRKPAQALSEAVQIVIDKQVGVIAIPRRFSVPMREIWQLQSRFHQRRGKRPLRLLAHPRFRAAYDFMLLRAQAGEIPTELADWWTDIQTADPQQQSALVLQNPGAGEATGGRRRRRGGKRRRANKE